MAKSKGASAAAIQMNFLEPMECLLVRDVGMSTTSLARQNAKAMPTVPRITHTPSFKRNIVGLL